MSVHVVESNTTQSNPKQYNTILLSIIETVAIGCKATQGMNTTITNKKHSLIWKYIASSGTSRWDTFYLITKGDTIRYFPDRSTKPMGCSAHTYTQQGFK
mmetsp:Transcript_7950/g.17086  ORF Transcript_7950/g.17086 Transcript_7950/m.17086 type:complete len:100 (+) Transcript_7950:1969-2268(+)